MTFRRSKTLITFWIHRIAQRQWQVNSITSSNVKCVPNGRNATMWRDKLNDDSCVNVWLDLWNDLFLFDIIIRSVIRVGDARSL